MATIIDVARRANVAISTVSNILNGTKYVSDEVVEKVMRAVKELDYEIDPVARNMKGVHSRMIGVVITNSSRIFFSSILRSVLKTASAQGYTVMTFDSNDDFEWEKKFITVMCQNRFDGILLDSVAEIDDSEYFQWLANLNYRNKRIYVASIERDLSAYGIDSVVPDNFEGACAVVRHLTQCGCKRLLHISGPINSSVAEERARGFYQTAEERSAEEKQVAFGDFSPQSGYDVIQKLAREKKLGQFDGIFAANDQMAVGAIKALAREGIRVPEDIRVVGFDNTFVASLIDPALTTVHVSGRQLGEEAVGMLISRLEEPDRPAQCKWLETKLIVRRSTDPNAESTEEFSSW